MNQIATTQNPFGQAPAQTSGSALVETESQRSIQEVQAAMVIAKKFPRNQIEAMDRILNACTRPSLAETAIYCYPRGGQEVTGPSIRLAETVAQEWGNIQFGIRELSSVNGSSTVEAFAWDVERNTRQVKVFQVAHTRHTKQGLKVLTDPRDIYEMVANQGARRLRACILGIIPGDVIEAAVDQCNVTQKTNVDTSPETIKKMLDSFKNEYGVTEEMIQKRIGKRVESINAMQVLNLRRIFQSMREGMSKPADWFEMPEGSNSGVSASSLNDSIKPADASAKGKKEKPAADVETDGETSAAYLKLMKGLEIAEDFAAIDAVVNMPDWSDLIDGEAAKLQAVVDEKRQSIM